MYQYKAYVTKVYDGDTITCDIDLGFGILLKKQKLRLAGINTPEVRGPGKEVGQYVRDIVAQKIYNKWIIIHTAKDKKGKYGRWLATVYYHDEQNDYSLSLNDWLVNEGHAVFYMKD